MFDEVLKITKHRVSDELSSQLGVINTGQARIMTGPNDSQELMIYYKFPLQHQVTVTS